MKVVLDYYTRSPAVAEWLRATIATFKSTSDLHNISNEANTFPVGQGDIIIEATFVSEGPAEKLEMLKEKAEEAITRVIKTGAKVEGTKSSEQEFQGEMLTDKIIINSGKTYIHAATVTLGLR